MIGYQISQQNYELIRDRIAQVLVSEFEYQAAIYYNPICDEVDGVYVERTTAIDKSETIAVNVSFDAGTYANKHAGSSDGTYMFFIDVFANAKSVPHAMGDVLAAYKVQQVMGIIRAILENPIYKRLSFPAGFIMRTMIMQIETLVIKAEDRQDAVGTRVGRISFEVRANESVPFKSANILDEFITRVKLSTTDKGMKYHIFGPYDWSSSDFNEDFNTIPGT